MKPEEVVTRSFYLYPRTDQAAKYECAGDVTIKNRKGWP